MGSPRLWEKWSFAECRAKATGQDRDVNVEELCALRNHFAAAISYPADKLFDQQIEQIRCRGAEKYGHEVFELPTSIVVSIFGKMCVWPSSEVDF